MVLKNEVQDQSAFRQYIMFYIQYILYGKISSLNFEITGITVTIK